ncbi:MAG: phenylalanine--tRNA ligase subunit beta [SAR324 cluster bacterium]|nr:phenylalanine--tRNA ligase subunit beta [SAR324 cluster bacterium]
MKISLNWVGDYINLGNTSLHEITNLLTLRVAEVESSYQTGQHLKDLLVAQVMSIKTHHNADKLSIVEVSWGVDKEVESIVCGANNFKVGDKVAYAPLGCQLPGGIKIKSTKIRGVLSKGMLCSEAELGFSDEHKGIMILPNSFTLGASLASGYPDQVDSILEIDNKSITHRPDLWGHFGYARELASIFKLPPPQLKTNIDWLSLKGGEAPLIKINIEEKKQVLKLICQGARGLKVALSPEIIRHRLYRTGLRAINNLVDVTNYVMLDLGQPMHVFDVDKIKSKQLTIKFANNNEKFISLYDKEYKLTDKELTFYEQSTPMAICGVIGGLNSGIDQNTKQIFLEAGNWKASLVRKTSIRLGTRTEAVQRYEKTIDPELTLFAIDKAWSILSATCPDMKRAGGLFYYDQHYFSSIKIDYRPELANRLLGINIDDDTQADILQRLGFKIKVIKNDKSTAWQVLVPSWRATRDVSIPEDLVEEVGRIFGYDKIIPQAPLFPIDSPRFNHQRLIERKLKATLVSRGFHEIINYPLTSGDVEKLLGATNQKSIKILNPALSDQDRLQSSVWPHFLTSIGENQKNIETFRQFELSKIYLQTAKQAQEIRKLALAFVPPVKQSYQTSFCQFKEDLLSLSLSMPYGIWELKESKNDFIFAHPLLQADIYCQEVQVGKVFQLNPAVHDEFAILKRTFLAEIDLEPLFALKTLTYRHTRFSKFPPVYFDISLVVSANYFYQDLVTKIKEINPKKIVAIKFLDSYPIENSNQISLTLRIVFQSFDRTLDSTEIKKLQDKVISALEKQQIFLKKMPL